MKIKFLPYLIPFFLFGCVTSKYNYQVFNVSPSNPKPNVSDSNSLISVQYNFWDFGGRTSLTIHNKTNTGINLDLSNSYFVMNGYSYKLLNSNTEILSSSTVRSVGTTINSNTYTTAKSNNTNFGIAPHASAEISVNYKIRESMYFDCQTDSFINSKTQFRIFDLNNTPNAFYYYLFGTTLKGDTIEYTSDTYYISGIATIEEKQFFNQVDAYNCGKKIPYLKINYVPLKSPERFYLIEKTEPIAFH